MTQPARFLADAMCGKLATYLRMCGYDTAYALDRGVEADDALRALAAREDRVLLTRDRQLAARTPDAVLLTARDPREQVEELRARGYDCTPTVARCGHCNGELDSLPGDASTPEHAPDPDEQPVWRCRDCGHLFWRGSHWRDLRARLTEAGAETEDGTGSGSESETGTPTGSGDGTPTESGSGDGTAAGSGDDCGHEREDETGNGSEAGRGGGGEDGERR